VSDSVDAFIFMCVLPYDDDTHISIDWPRNFELFAYILCSLSPVGHLFSDWRREGALGLPICPLCSIWSIRRRREGPIGLALRQMSNVGCQMSDVRCQMSDVRRPMSDVRCRMSDVRCRMSDVRCQMSDVRCQTSDVRCQMSDVRCQMSDVRCQMSDVRW
jgi:hypothetical protein